MSEEQVVNEEVLENNENQEQQGEAGEHMFES